MVCLTDTCHPYSIYYRYEIAILTLKKFCQRDNLNKLYILICLFSAWGQLQTLCCYSSFWDPCVWSLHSIHPFHAGPQMVLHQWQLGAPGETSKTENGSSLTVICLCNIQLEYKSFFFCLHACRPGGRMFREHMEVWRSMSAILNHYQTNLEPFVQILKNNLDYLWIYSFQ